MKLTNYLIQWVPFWPIVYIQKKKTNTGVIKLRQIQSDIKIKSYGSDIKNLYGNTHKKQASVSK